MEEARNIGQEWFTDELFKMAGNNEETKERMRIEIRNFLKNAWEKAHDDVLNMTDHMATTGVGDYDFDDLADGIEQCLMIRRLVIWTELESTQLEKDKEEVNKNEADR